MSNIFYLTCHINPNSAFEHSVAQFNPYLKSSPSLPAWKVIRNWMAWDMINVKIEIKNYYPWILNTTFHFLRYPCIWMIKLTWSWDIAYVVEIETSEHLVLLSSWMVKIILTLATLQSYIKSFPNLRYSKKPMEQKIKAKIHKVLHHLCTYRHCCYSSIFDLIFLVV